MAVDKLPAFQGHLSHNNTLCLQIKDFVKQMLRDLSQGKLPSVSLSKYQICLRFSKDSRSTVYEEAGSQEKLGLHYNGSARRLDVKTIDQAINDICIRFHCNRSSLHVVSVSKGLVMGWVSYEEDGRRVDCMKYSCTGFSIPVRTNLVQNITSLAEFILLVEKETVFQRLANDGFCVKNRCIILSGKGYPDVATRSFLRLLKDKLGLPIFALVDGDPHGLDILLTYTFGSLSMAYDAEALATPHIYWLGIHLSDCEAFGIPTKCLLPLSTRDNQKASAILKRGYLKHYVPSWSGQVELMLQQGVKLEIEAVASVSFSFLADVYLPSKLKNAAYL